MISAFASALDALFADPNIGRDAVYIADGGAPVSGPRLRSSLARMTRGR
jgi:hypothetical protein